MTLYRERKFNLSAGCVTSSGTADVWAQVYPCQDIQTQGWGEWVGEQSSSCPSQDLLGLDIPSSHSCSRPAPLALHHLI